MEFLKVIKRRSFLNEVIYVILNIAIAFALLFIIRLTGSLLLAFALVLLGQWRVFAVRPRFWFAHIQANIVGTIVSVGFVVFLYVANLSGTNIFETILMQVFFTLLYIGWLLFLKSQSKRVYIVAQAGVALFVGITAIFNMSYNWFASPVVILTWLVGYGTARHILSSYDEESHTQFLSVIWGIVLSEICWLAYHWTIAYRLIITKSMFLPQVSIITLCFAFVVYKSYDSFHHHQKIRMNDIILPLVFSISVIAILVLAFNGVMPRAS